MKKLLSLIIAISICASLTLTACNKDIPEDKTASSVSSVSTSSEDSSEVEYVHSENPVIAEPSTCPLSDKQIAAVVDNAEKIIDDSDFSGTVLISVGNQIIFEESYGYADKNKTENTNDTHYQIGSITKQFTGTAILLLEREGKLKVTDTLDKYFQGDDYLKNITVEHLLKMTCGMRDYMETIEGDTELFDKYIAAAKKSDKDAQDFIVKVILDEGIYTNPGEVYCYSNSAYYLLGVIIEQLTGMTYRDYVQQNFFDPAGMTESYFVGDGMDYQTGYSLAKEAYISDKDDKYLTAAGGYPYLFSAGAVVSTAEDINKWLDTVDSGTVIGETEYKKIEKAEYMYNYGWNTSDNCWHHSGRTYAYSSQIFFDYKTDVKLVMLSNIQFYDALSTDSFNIFNPVNNAVKKVNK